MGTLVACSLPEWAGRGLLRNHERTMAQTMGLISLGSLLDLLAGEALAGSAFAL
ncbi:MAG TPA: hypothetical protein PLA97_04465 [Rubrivivax sp.]|nr:hypothetical protein [Rubrivivax sp.]